MKIINAIKKLEKAGFKVSKDGSQHTGVKSGLDYIIEFYQNGREDSLACINVRRPDDLSDAMTDYSAGTFCDNITQAIRLASRF